MNMLSIKTRARVLHCLLEGNSINSTVRLTDVAKNTVLKLLRDIGKICFEFHDKLMRNLPCKRIQCDEIWGFCYSKQANVPKDKEGQFGYGDVWTWIAIDPETKLVPSFLVGLRDVYHAKIFMEDLASRLANRVHLTTDGHRPYLEAVESGFGNNIDYVMLSKLYGRDEDITEARYSRSRCIGTRVDKIIGNPNRHHASTSLVERQNLTIRMSMRRFTRLTNGFSKKVENLKYAMALHIMYYNFCRIHQSLRVTPAMEVGLTNRVWEIEDILKLT